MKKTLSILLTILMVFSVMSVTASAIEADYEIRCGETMTVTAASYESEKNVYIKFTPEKDGRYILKSETDDLDPYCGLYDSTLENLVNADDENGVDFILEYVFTAGETYYFKINTYSEQTEEIRISLVCGHMYEDGVCLTCGIVCYHSEIKSLGYCLCGDVFLGVDIADGDELEHDAAEHNNEAGWYRFVPEESGAFYIESFSDPDANGDAICDLYDANGEWLHYNDDKEEDLNFKLIYNFEAGETYYFEVQNYYEDAVFTFKLNRANHIADDGSVHYVEYVAETDSDCKEHGYSEGFYCSDCDEYVWGHEEKELSILHFDYDEDGICDKCGINMAGVEYPDEEPDVEACDKCGEVHTNFFQRLICAIRDFFNRIISFFTGLFN